MIVVIKDVFYIELFRTNGSEQDLSIISLPES